MNVRCRGDRSFEFDPATTALAVIDMQRDFFHDAPEMRAVVPRVAGLLDWGRRLGLTVVHTREGYEADLSDVNSYKRSLGYVGRVGPNGRFLIRGERGHDFLEGFEPRDDELVFDKAGFSGFHGTGLGDHLSGAGITHLILCGVTTQCCVHSTLRDAVERGYFCLTVADCCAAAQAAVHEATLQIIQAENHLFGWIADSSAALDVRDVS